MFIPTIAQEQGSDWIDVLFQIGIFGTFVVFAIAMVFIKIGMSAKSSEKTDDASE